MGIVWNLVIVSVTRVAWRENGGLEGVGRWGERKRERQFDVQRSKRGQSPTYLAGHVTHRLISRAVFLFDW